MKNGYQECPVLAGMIQAIEQHVDWLCMSARYQFSEVTGLAPVDSWRLEPGGALGFNRSKKRCG
jgi:hypothetical protein